jgi:hypothetical protein
MTDCTSSIRSRQGTSPLFQLRIWNLVLLVGYVAIAIVDIQDHRRGEPALIALASAGFALYGIMCWLGWHGMRRLEPRLGLLLVVIIYAVTMAILFLIATLSYLGIEYAYLTGLFA